MRIRIERGGPLCALLKFIPIIDLFTASLQDSFMVTEVIGCAIDDDRGVQAQNKGGGIPEGIPPPLLFDSAFSEPDYTVQSKESNRRGPSHQEA